MKKFLASAGVICCSFITLAANWVYDSSAKTLTRGSVVVSNVTYNTKNLTIGDNRTNPLATDLDFSVAIDDDYVLKNINGAAFNGNTNVQTLITPTTLTWIGNNAFSSCTGLTKLRLADGLTEVQQQCFSSCTALSDWDNKLPSTLTLGGKEMFLSCSSLNGEVIIPEAYTASYNCMFRGTGISKIKFTKTTTITGYACFHSMPNLTVIDLPETLTTLGAERIFGDWGNHIAVTIYWRSCPTSFASNLYTGTNSGVITHYMPWRCKSEWDAFAETNTALTMPTTFDGTGTWASQIVKWWNDKPNGLRISIR